MDFILLHVSEFYSWAATSYLRIDVSRILTLNVDSDESVQTLFDSYGHILISEPESYVVANLRADWRSSLRRPARTRSGSLSVFPLEVVQEFHALTEDARLRLGSQAERLFIVLGVTKLERFWRNYQKSEELAQDDAAGKLFLDLFNFPKSHESRYASLQSLSDERLNQLLDRIADHEGLHRLQKVKLTAEYGLYEFGIRLANSFPKEWRSNDSGYARFREVRSRYLEAKSWDSTSYLDYPEIVKSLVALDDISKETIGVDPFAAACFFLQRAQYELSGKRSVDFSSLSSDAKKLISIDRLESCLLFLYLVGRNLGLEVVSKIHYHLNAEKFPTIRSESINRNLNGLNVDAFDLTSRSLGDEANQNEILDQGGVAAVTSINILPLVVLNGSEMPTAAESAGPSEDIKEKNANSGENLAISSLGNSTDSAPAKVEVVEPGQNEVVEPTVEPVEQIENFQPKISIPREDVAISSLVYSTDCEPVKIEVVEPDITKTTTVMSVLEPTPISVATSTATEAEIPTLASSLSPDSETSAGKKNSGGGQNGNLKAKSSTKRGQKNT